MSRAIILGQITHRPVTSRLIRISMSHPRRHDNSNIKEDGVTIAGVLSNNVGPGVLECSTSFENRRVDNGILENDLEQGPRAQETHKLTDNFIMALYQPLCKSMARSRCQTMGSCLVQLSVAKRARHRWRDKFSNLLRRPGLQMWPCIRPSKIQHVHRRRSS